MVAAIRWTLTAGLFVWVGMAGTSWPVVIVLALLAVQTEVSAALHRQHLREIDAVRTQSAANIAALVENDSQLANTLNALSGACLAGFERIQKTVLLGSFSQTH